MSFLVEVFLEAVRALGDFGPELREVVGLTLLIALLSTLLGCLLGIPLGVAVALGRSRGLGVVRTLIGVGMGLPPVLVGLVLLLLLWRAGPFGGLGLTFTPTAMVIAQTVLAAPVAAGVTLAAVEGLPESAREQLGAMRLPYLVGARLALVETRSGVIAAAAAAFGRVIGEVGAVLVIGGNILGETRVLTTLIVQESRQGRFGIAIAAGMVLLFLSLMVNVGFERLRRP